MVGARRGDVRALTRASADEQQEHCHCGGGLRDRRGRGGCAFRAPAAALREEAVERQKQERGKQEPLVARRLRLAGGRNALLTAERRQRRTHAAGLVRHGRVDEAAVGRLRRCPQKLGLVVRDDHLTVVVALRRRDAPLANRNRGSPRRAEADGDQTDVLLARAARLGDHVLHRLERLAVTHDDQRAIRATFREQEQIGALANGAGERAARLTHDRGIEVVEEEIERASVHRQWREHVAPTGKRDQSHAVAARHRAQAAHLFLHARESVGPLVRGDHRERRVEGEYHVDAPRPHDGLLRAPAWPGDGDTDERAGGSQSRHAPAHRSHATRGHQASHDLELAEAREARTPLAVGAHQ